MPTSSPPPDVAELQVTFLKAEDVTPSLLRDTLEALLSVETTTTPNLSLSLWVSMAVLHTLTDAQLATRISSIEAVSALLAIGLRASENLRNEAPSASSTSLTPARQASLAIPSQLHVIQSSFEAWSKTGMVARTQQTSESIWPATGGEGDDGDEEDEEAAWFDSKATPSPMPTAAPSILLSSLISSFSKPELLASLIAPYPDRLAVWLRSVPSSLYTTHVWPHRLEILKSGMVHHAIAGDDAEVVQALATNELLPLPGFETETETSLWSALLSYGQKSDVEMQLLAGKADLMDGPQIAGWYLSQGRLLANTFHATSISAALADAAVKAFSQAAAAEQPTLRNILQQLASLAEEGQATGQHLTGAATSRELLADPAKQVLRSLKSGNPVDLSKTLDLIVNRSGRLSSDVAREALFEAFASKSLSSEHLHVLLSEADGGDAGQAQRILMSMVLASNDGHRCSLLIPVTDKLAASTSAGTSASITRIFPRLEHNGKIIIPEAPVLPSAEGIYHSVRDNKQSSSSASSLADQCKLYLWCLSHEGALAAGLVEMPPFVVLLAAGNKKVQTALVKRLITSVSKAGLDDATSWINLSDDLLSQISSDKLFDALAQTEVVEELLQGALLSSHSSAAYSLLIGRLPSLPGPQLDSVLIGSARELFDRVQGGRPAVSDLRTVRNILSLSSSAASSADMAASQAFLRAVLRLMQLSHPLSSSLHPSLLMSPLEIRLATDKVDIIRHWLGSTNDTAWKREDDVLETAWGLVQGSGVGMLGDKSQSTEVGDAQVDGDEVEVESVPSKSMVKVRVLALLAEAAISNGDLTLTTQYVESMLQSFRELLKRSRRLSANPTSKTTSSLSFRPAAAEAQAEVKRGQETVWTTLFLLSKHPSCTEAAATRRWLAEGLAYAPEERVPDLLKRWRSLPAPTGGESGHMATSGSTRNEGQQQRTHLSAASSSLDNSAAHSATSSTPGVGLGSGVFSLAAAAVNRSHWPLRLGSGGGAAHPATGPSQSSPRSAAAAAAGGAGTAGGAAGAGASSRSLGTSGVGNALSSLAGQLGEGYGAYGSRLTGFLSSTSGGANANAGHTAGSSTGWGSRPSTPSFEEAHTSSAQGAAEPHVPIRSAAQLFDDAAAGHGQGHTGGGGGWAALGTRGMGWLMGEEERRASR